MMFFTITNIQHTSTLHYLAVRKCNITRFIKNILSIHRETENRKT